MEFDSKAKANSVSAVLQVLKWAIWGITTFFVFILYLVGPEEDPNWNYRGILAIVAGIGYGIGYFVQRYHDSILREPVTGTSDYSLQAVDEYLKNATPAEKHQIDKAWEAPRDNTPVNGIELNAEGLRFMKVAYKQKLSPHDRRRILLSLYSGADIGLLYDLLPTGTSKRKVV